MHIETSQNNYGSENIFVSFERTNIIQNSNITFYYNRFSTLTNDSSSRVVSRAGGGGVVEVPMY